jgi:hypothetical protein
LDMSAIPTVTVTAKIYDQKGNPVPKAVISMRLSTVERYEGYVVPHIVRAETDEDGVAHLEVWPNELGSEGSEYEVTIRYPNFHGNLLHWPGDGHPHGCHPPHPHHTGHHNHCDGMKTLRAYAVVPNADCELQYIIELEPYELRGAGQILTAEIAQYAAIAETSADTASTAAAQAAASAEAAADSASEAKEDADRAQEWGERAEFAASETFLESGAFNIRRTFVAPDDILEGGILHLPVGYYPTRATLFLTYHDVPCTPRDADLDNTGKYQYEEIGVDPNLLSSEIRVWFPVKAGDKFDLWIVASAWGRNLDQQTALVAQAAASAEAAADSADAAAASAALASGARQAATAAASEAATSAETAAASASSATSAAQAAFETVMETVEGELDNIRDLAAGALSGIVFDDTDQVNAWLAGDYARDDELTPDDLRIGENIFIREVDEPDYWWDGTSLQLLGTNSVTLSDYYTSIEVDEKLTSLRQDVKLDEAYVANSALVVPAYTVGAHKLFVYLYGVLCNAGETASEGFYAEIGDTGATSTSIAIFENLSIGTNLSFVSTV